MKMTRSLVSLVIWFLAAPTFAAVPLQMRVKKITLSQHETDEHFLADAHGRLTADIALDPRIYTMWNLISATRAVQKYSPGMGDILIARHIDRAERQNALMVLPAKPVQPVVAMLPLEGDKAIADFDPETEEYDDQMHNAMRLLLLDNTADAETLKSLFDADAIDKIYRKIRAFIDFRADSTWRLDRQPPDKLNRVLQRLPPH